MATWIHFIGGQYRSEAAFIREARRFGISRRVPAQSARGMAYGDRVVLARWFGKERGAYGFASFRVTDLIFEGEMAQKVAKKLEEEGLTIKYTPAGGGERSPVQRECGSYMVLGVITIENNTGRDIDTSLKRMIELALEISKDEDEKLFIMIGGKLEQVYDTPVKCPDQKFHRGISRVSDAEIADGPRSNSLVAVGDYRKSKPKRGKKSSGWLDSFPPDDLGINMSKN
jgi:hypothetical protein